MKIPVRRCRTAVLTAASLSLLVACFAAAFMPKTQSISSGEVETQQSVSVANRMRSASSGQSREGELGRAMVSLSMYSEANPEAGVLCYLAAGETFEVTSPAGPNWYQIRYDDLVGYVSAAQIETGVSADDDYQISTYQAFTEVYGTPVEELWVRSIPSRDGDVLTTIQPGQVVQLLSFEDGWYYIDAQGVLGYIVENYITWEEAKPDWAITRDELAYQAAIDEATGSLVETAKSFLGVPYVWAASGPSRFDCSGFTMYLYRQMGYSLPHSAARQLTEYGTWVEESDLIPGDLVFFSDGSKAASHVGMYIGDGAFIHASSAAHCVTINSLSDSWYDQHYVGAKRILEF